MNSFWVQANDARDNVIRAKLARLHAGLDGTLISTLENLARQGNQIKATVSIATNINDVDVGVCVIEECGLIGTYVKPNYRGNKIGEQLVKIAMEKSGRTVNTCYAFEGIEQEKSFKFYKRLGIFVDGHCTLYKTPFDLKSQNSLTDKLRLQLTDQNFDNNHFLWNYFSSREECKVA